MLFTIQLFATVNIKSTYYITSNTIYLKDIIKDTTKNIKIAEIEPYRYSKRISRLSLFRILKKNGYNQCKTSLRYITFIKKSPISTTKIKLALKKYYQKYYNDIHIKNIIIQPRGFIKSLPKNYIIDIQTRNYLSHKNILSIKSLNNKRIFFDYTLDADIKVILSKNSLDKGLELTTFNTYTKYIPFHRFMATPLENLKPHTLEIKWKIKKDKIITTRDVKQLDLVKRGDMINVSLNGNGLSISFMAKSIQNGKYGDIITIQKQNRTRLKAMVVGKNRVEIR